MRLHGPSDIIRKAVWREAERSRGLTPGLMRLSATRAADVQIPDVTKLPCTLSNPMLFAPDGSAYFLLDYSALDGPDVLR